MTSVNLTRVFAVIREFHFKFAHASLLFPVMRRGYHIRIVLNPEHKSNSFIPASLFQPLPSHSAKSTVRRNTLSRPLPPQTKDYRYGPITIDWIDFDHMGTVLNSSKDKAGRARGKFDDTEISGPTSRLAPRRSSRSHLCSAHPEQDRDDQPSRGYRACIPRRCEQTFAGGTRRKGSQPFVDRRRK